MARAAAAPPPIRFRGVPASLTAVVAEGLDPLSDPVLVLGDAPRKGESAEIPVQVDLDPRILRLILPGPMAPGMYPAVLRTDRGELPARVEVESAPSLRVIPEQLRLRAAPGAEVATDLTVLNQGNVAVDLRKVQPFGVFLDGGLERALRRAYVDRLEQGERRVDVIADNLADAHGGLVKMKIVKGAGPIAPGELRSIDVLLEMPGGLASGSTYAGNWELAGLVYPVTIWVEGGSSEPPEEEKPEPVKAAPPKAATTGDATSKAVAAKATAAKSTAAEAATTKAAATKAAAAKSATTKAATTKAAAAKSATTKAAATKAAEAKAATTRATATRAATTKAASPRAAKKKADGTT